MKIKQIIRGVACVTVLAFSLNSVVPAYALPVVELVPAAPKSFGFQIPSELGKIERLSVAGPKAPSIIHIQSAHGNLGAQKKIKEILKHITRNSGHNLLALEGASGELHPEQCLFFPDDPKLNQKVTDELLKRSLLTGPEVFLIDNFSSKNKALGIENPALYRENRKYFLEVHNSRNAIEAKLSRQHRKLDQISTRILNPELLTFVKRFYPLNEEARLSPEILAYLEDKSGQKLTPNPREPQLFLRQMEYAKTKALNVLTRRSGEKEIIALRADFILFSKLLRLKLNRDEARRLFAKGIHPDLIKMSELDQSYDAALGFYRAALKRDDILFQNTLNVLRSSGERQIILITGGFHTVGISELAKENHLSYLSISPKLEEFEKTNHYSVALRESVSGRFSAATLEQVLRTQLPVAQRNMGADPEFFKREADKVLIQVGHKKEAHAKTKAASLGENGDVYTQENIAGAIHALKLITLLGSGAEEVKFLENPRFVSRKSKDGSFKVFDLTTAREIPIPEDKSGRTLDSVHSSQDGKRIIAVYFSKATDDAPEDFRSKRNFFYAKILDITSKQVAEISLGSASSEGSSFISPDGRYLYVGMNGTPDQIFDLVLWKYLSVKIYSEPRNIEFTHDGKCLRIFSSDHSSYIINLDCQKIILLGVSENIKGVNYSPNGTYAIVKRGHFTAPEWFNLITGEKLNIDLDLENTAVGYPNVNCGFSQDEKTLFIWVNHVYVRLIDLPSSQKKYDVPNGRNVSHISFAGNGNFIHVAYMGQTKDEDRNKVFHTASGKQIQIPNESQIEELKFSPKGKYLFVRYRDVSPKIFDISTMKELTEVKLGPIASPHFHPQNENIVFVTSKTELGEKEASASDLLSKSKLPFKIAPNMTPSFSKSGRFAILTSLGATDGVSQDVVETKTGQNIKFLLGPAKKASMSGDEKSILITDKNGESKIFDITTFTSNPILKTFIRNWKGKAWQGLDILSKLLHDELIKNKEALMTFDLLFMAYAASEINVPLYKAYPVWKEALASSWNDSALIKRLQQEVKGANSKAKLKILFQKRPRSNGPEQPGFFDRLFGKKDTPGSANGSSLGEKDAEAVDEAALTLLGELPFYDSQAIAASLGAAQPLSPTPDNIYEQVIIKYQEGLTNGQQASGTAQTLKYLDLILRVLRQRRGRAEAIQLNNLEIPTDKGKFSVLVQRLNGSTGKWDPEIPASLNGLPHLKIPVEQVDLQGIFSHLGIGRYFKLTIKVDSGNGAGRTKRTSERLAAKPPLPSQSEVPDLAMPEDLQHETVKYKNILPLPEKPSAKTESGIAQAVAPKAPSFGDPDFKIELLPQEPPQADGFVPEPSKRMANGGSLRQKKTPEPKLKPVDEEDDSQEQIGKLNYHEAAKLYRRAQIWKFARLFLIALSIFGVVYGGSKIRKKYFRSNEEISADANISFRKIMDLIWAKKFREASELITELESEKETRSFTAFNFQNVKRFLDVFQKFEEGGLRNNDRKSIADMGKFPAKHLYREEIISSPEKGEFKLIFFKDNDRFLMHFYCVRAISKVFVISRDIMSKMQANDRRQTITEISKDLLFAADYAFLPPLVAEDFIDTLKDAASIIDNDDVENISRLLKVVSITENLNIPNSAEELSRIRENLEKKEAAGLAKIKQKETEAQKHLDDLKRFEEDRKVKLKREEEIKEAEEKKALELRKEEYKRQEIEWKRQDDIKLKNKKFYAIWKEGLENYLNPTGELGVRPGTKVGHKCMMGKEFNPFNLYREISKKVATGSNPPIDGLIEYEGYFIYVQRIEKSGPQPINDLIATPTAIALSKYTPFITYKFNSKDVEYELLIMVSKATKDAYEKKYGKSDGKSLGAKSTFNHQEIAPLVMEFDHDVLKQLLNKEKDFRTDPKKQIVILLVPNRSLLNSLKREYGILLPYRGVRLVEWKHGLGSTNKENLNTLISRINASIAGVYFSNGRVDRIKPGQIVYAAEQFSQDWGENILRVTFKQDQLRDESTRAALLKTALEALNRRQDWAFLFHHRDGDNTYEILPQILESQVQAWKAAQLYEQAA